MKPFRVLLSIMVLFSISGLSFAHSGSEFITQKQEPTIISMGPGFGMNAQEGYPSASINKIMQESQEIKNINNKIEAMKKAIDEQGKIILELNNRLEKLEAAENK